MGLILLIMGKNESYSSMYGTTGTNSGATWTCRKCGDKNSMGNSYCKGCGEYKPVGIGSSGNKNSAPVVKNEGDEWTCKKCNEKNPLSASNCKSCGAYK